LIDSNFFKKSELNIKNVSRETFNDLNEYVNLVVHKNKEINMISKSSEKSINTRHLLDSAQIIDFVDKNDIKLCTDLGSGAGFPGIVLAILMKSKNPLFKVIFYEKSFHKSNFLRSVGRKLNLNSEINQKNIFEEKNLITDIIVSRAFKPLPIIFEIAVNNFKKFKYIIIFLGKSGKEILKDAKKKWNFDYIEKKSLTSDESIVIKISNLKKKWIKK
jgi:16S rRNA (guanine527-N7)-methyltransferase